MSHISDANLLKSQEKILNSIWFKTSKNITNERIHAIFSNRKKLQEPVEDPYFIVLIGSPGVGKTYTLNNILGNKLDNFYKVSLDSILEKIVPYRNATKKIYNSIKGDLNEQKDPNVTFTKSNIKLLNLASTYLSARNNFGIPNRLSNRGLGEKTKNKTKSIYGKFYEIADKALEYALENGYNIIYDTTTTGDSKKIGKILNMITTKAKRKYKVRVILVEAGGKDEDQVDTITSRLNQRHRNMLSEGYIRVIDKDSILKHIIANRKGFEVSEKEFTSTDKYDIKFDNISTISKSNKNKYDIQENNSIDQVIAKIPKKEKGNNNTKKNNTKKNNTKKNNNISKLMSQLAISSLTNQ